MGKQGSENCARSIHHLLKAISKSFFKITKGEKKKFKIFCFIMYAFPKQQYLFKCSLHTALGT